MAEFHVDEYEEFPEDNKLTGINFGQVELGIIAEKLEEYLFSKLWTKLLVDAVDREVVHTVE